MILYCNRCTILFTQIVHKKTNTKNKENIFNLTVQYLEKNSTVSTTSQLLLCLLLDRLQSIGSQRVRHNWSDLALTHAFGHPGLEIKILYYNTMHNTVKYRKAQPLVEDSHTWQYTSDTWTKLCDWMWKCISMSLKVCNLRLLYRGLYCISILK